MNLRSYTLDRLSKVSLDGKASEVIMTIPTKSINEVDGSHYGDYTYQAYKLDNGITVYLTPDTENFSLEVVDNNGVIHNATKWFTYTNFFRLVDIMSMAQDVARDIDLAIFSVVKNVFDVMLHARTSFRDVLLSDSNYTFVNVKYNNTEHGLFALSRRANNKVSINKVIGKNNAMIYLGELERLISGYGTYDQIKENALSSQTAECYFYKIAARSFNNLVIDAVDLDIKESIHNTRTIFNERPNYILADITGVESFEIPLSYLDDIGVGYSFCIYSKQAVLDERAGHSSSVSFNAFGPVMNRVGSLVLSNEILDYHLNDEYCSVCNDSQTTIDANFIEEVEELIQDLDERRAFVEQITNRYEISEGHDYMCRYCERKERQLQDNLSSLGISYSGNSFTLKENTQTYSMMYGSDIHEYSYKPDFNLYHLGDESDSDLHLGVELEVDEAGEQGLSSRIITAVINSGIDSEYAYTMHDGSLSDGFEIATQPSSLLFHMGEVDYEGAFKVARSLGYRSHDTSSCGLHVHMNRRFFGSSRATQNIKAAFMALILERNWDSVVKFSRRNYHNLEEWADKKDFADYVYSTDSDDAIANKFLDSYEDKYVALNTQHRNSFELRIFRGTLRYETYIATLQFVSNLAHISKACTTLTRAQQISFEDIINFKRYAELDNYLKTRGMFVESDDTPVVDVAPTLFDVAAQ